MRILIVHYRYFVHGGPERYLFAVKNLLEQAGHEVVVFSVAYEQNAPSQWSPYFVPPIAGSDEAFFANHTWTPRSAARALKAMFYSPEARRSLTRLIADSRPDVALALQYLRKMSPSILTALRRGRVPVVVRLSDFHLVCPASTLTRNGQLCQECIGRLPLASVRYGCVKGSRAVSAMELLATALHRASGVFNTIDAFVAPTSYMRDAMVRGGWPRELVRVIATPVSVPPARDQVSRDVLLYVGRIDRLKGVFTALDAFSELVARMGAAAPDLVFIGGIDHPQGQDLEARVGELGLQNRVIFTGELDLAGVRRWFDRGILSLIPSLCVDNLPNSLLESLAAGVPVVISNQPTLQEAIANYEVGAVVPAGDHVALADAVAELIGDPVRLAAASDACRRLAQDRYSESAHLESLVQLFEELVSDSPPARPRGATVVDQQPSPVSRGQRGA